MTKLHIFIDRSVSESYNMNIFELTERAFPNNFLKKNAIYDFKRSRDIKDK